MDGNMRHYNGGEEEQMRYRHICFMVPTLLMGVIFLFLLGTGSALCADAPKTDSSKAESAQPPDSAINEKPEPAKETDLKKETPEKTYPEELEEEYESIDEADKEGIEDYINEEAAREMIEKSHGRISRTILSSARWIDSFFEHERVEHETNKTRVKAKISSFTEDDQGWDLGVSASLKLVLPELNDRIAIEFSGDPEDESNIESKTYQGSVREDFRDTKEENFTAAIRYFLEATDKRNINISTGLRIRDIEPIAYIGPRYREDFDWGRWTFRATQRFRWYTDDGLQSKTSFDLERPLYEKFFFRSSVGGAWFEDEHGYFYGINFSLGHPLSHVRAIEYEWNNSFQTRPYNRMEEVNFRVRYRQRLAWDWLTLEVAPQISFPKDRDYEPTLGLLFRLEAIFGFVRGGRI